MRSPTIKEVAARSGVGIGTVSRVLNDSPQISESTRQKVMKAIEELHYVPNVAGKRLSQSRSNVIAVVVPVINHPFFAKLVEEIELAADQKGYSLLVASSQHRIEKEQEILHRLAQKQADGAIFVTHYEHQENDFKNLAIVTIDRHLGNDIPIVSSNNYEATKQGVRYLIEKGCHKIAFLGTRATQSSEVTLREKAYREVMEENGLESFVINKDVEHGQEKVLVDELLANRDHIDGIFVSGCILANTLFNRLKALHIKVPEELQIVSYDGDFSISKLENITTLEQPIKEMAEKCVELLIKIMENKNDYEKVNILDCRFVKGDTTK